MLKIFSSLFGSRKKERFSKESDIIQYAENVLSGLGIYATNSMSDDWQKWEQKMRDDLASFERHAKKYSSPRLYTLAGNGWGLFSTWYRRKHEDKTTPLLRAISLFEEALKIDPNFEDAKISLGGMLIERKQVRDLDRGVLILNEVQSKSGHVQALINEAKRWRGEIEFDPTFDYTKVQLLPLGELREERKKCRSLIRSLKKAKKTDEMHPVLEHMYRIAVLHDVATYVMINGDYFIDEKKDKVWDKKLEKIARNVTRYSYVSHGKLVFEDAALAESDRYFLSKNDYKSFELIFSKTDKTFDPAKLL